MKSLSLQPVEKLPKGRYVLAAGLFLFSLAGWMRCILSILNWNFYQSLRIQPGPGYLLVNGLVAAMVYTSAGILVLIPGEKWKKPLSFLLFSGLVVYWIDRICFARSFEAQTALPFSLVMSAGLTLLAVSLLYGNTLRRQIQKWKK